MSIQLTLKPVGGLIERDYDGPIKDRDYKVEGLDANDSCYIKRSHSGSEWFVVWDSNGQVVETPASFRSSEDAFEWVKKKDGERLREKLV